MSGINEYLEQRAYFLGCGPQKPEGSKLILGVPLDLTTSARPGTRLAPYRIREVSDIIDEYSVYRGISLDDCDYSDAGDIILPLGNVAASLERIEAVAESFLSRQKRLFSLGGEHLASLPLIKAYSRFYPDLAVVHLDAHADLRPDYLGEQYSHASVMRRVVEILGKDRLYQLGIRTAAEEELAFARKYTCLYIDQVLEKVSEVLEKVGPRPVYFSLDIDVLDPAFAPGTGTPEGAGISSRELLQAMHQLADLNIVGFDLVEVAPPYDAGDSTSILAAKLLREALLCYGD